MHDDDILKDMERLHQDRARQGKVRQDKVE